MIVRSFVILPGSEKVASLISAKSTGVGSSSSEMTFKPGQNFKYSPKLLFTSDQSHPSLIFVVWSCCIGDWEGSSIASNYQTSHSTWADETRAKFLALHVGVHRFGMQYTHTNKTAQLKVENLAQTFFGSFYLAFVRPTLGCESFPVANTPAYLSKLYATITVLLINVV